MAFLDGLIRAGLVGTTGFMAGRADRDARARADAEKAAERERQAEQDALRAGLIRAQTEAELALTANRRATETPTTYNPATDLPTQREQYFRAQGLGRYGRTGIGSTERTLTAGQAHAAADNESAGRSIMLTMGSTGSAPAPLKRAFWQAWTYAARQQPAAPKGELAKQVLAGLRSANPQLFTDGAGGGEEDSDFGATGGEALIPPAYAQGRLTGPQLLANAQARLQGQPEPFPSGGETHTPAHGTGYSPAVDSMVATNRAAQPAESTSARRPLTPEEKQAAATDAGFRAFLQQKGYTPRDWPGSGSLDPATLTEARSLIRGSPNPADDLRAAGFSDAEITMILGH